MFKISDSVIHCREGLSTIVGIKDMNGKDYFLVSVNHNSGETIYVPVDTASSIIRPLMSKQEALDSQVFGEGKIHPKAPAFLGDFVATSIDEVTLYASKEMNKLDIFKGHHAGNTQEEMLIDVSAYNV